ncbi:MAG TPA: response regulator transcription factor [Bacteroidetes bacterium]|nr:response regulator transcription factor [Bacteroidota bacterium]
MIHNKTRILVADDHPIFLRGLAQIIETDVAFTIVAEASHGEQALQLMREEQPDIAVLDINMPKKDGFEVVNEMRSQGLSGTKIVFLTMYDDESYLDSALDLGVSGYLLKENATGEVLHCLRAILNGRLYISPTLSGYLVARQQQREALLQKVAGLDSLTPSERKILRLLARGLTSRDMAATLHISIRTVQNHRNNICRKLDLRGHNKLLEFAIQHKSEL